MASLFSITKSGRYEDGSSLHEIRLILNKNDHNHNSRDLMQEIKDLVKQWNEEVYAANKVP